MSRAFGKLARSLVALSLAIGFSLAASPVVQAADDCLPGFTLVGEVCENTFTPSQGAGALQVPAGLGAFEIELFGAAGGSGGLDGTACQRAFGGEAGYLLVRYPDLSNKTLNLYPGARGADGLSGARGSGGGSGGGSLLGDEFNGGRGGNTGTTGSSGGGGGGGAATVLDVGSERFVAAGAGGGGGCANSANGSTWGSAAESYTADSNGGAGLSTSGNPYFDGGGGGGGGGGIKGGQGGQLYKASGNESAGFGGNAGTSTPAAGKVGISKLQDSNVAGKIIVRYTPILGTKSIELIGNNPTAENFVKYKVTLKSSREFRVKDVVLSGTIPAAQQLDVVITSVPPKIAPFEHSVVVSPKNKNLRMSGSLAVTVFDTTSSIVLIDAAGPKAKINFVEETQNQPTKIFQVSFDESVQGLSADDFVAGDGLVENCEIDLVIGSDGIYRVSLVNCAEGAFGLTLRKGSVVDSLGNPGPYEDAFSGIIGVGQIADKVSPTAALKIQGGTLSTDSHIFDVRFSEGVNGLTSQSFVTDLGTSRQCEVGPIRGFGAYYQVSLEGCTDGTFGLALKASSVKDLSGNKGPQLTVASPLSMQSTKETTISIAPGEIPKSLESNPLTRIFDELDLDIQMKMLESGVMAPIPGAPTVTVLTDLSNANLSEEIALTAIQEVEVGSTVRLSLDVSPEIAAVSDVVSFMEVDGLWQYLGRTSFEGTSANSAEFTLAKLGNFNVRLVIIGKNVITNLSVPKTAGFGTGAGVFVSSLTQEQTQLSSQIVDLTLSAIAGPNGVPTLIAPVSEVPGSQTDENAPSQPYDPLASPEGIKAIAEAIGTAVVVAAAVAGAVAAAAAGGGGARVGAASGASSQNTDSSEGEISTLDSEVESFTTAKVSWGDKIPIFKLKALTFLDVYTHDLTLRMAKFSPVLSKVINDGAYLRSIFGSMWLALPVTGVVLAAVALAQPAVELKPPIWQIFLAIAVLGMFDAFSGLIATLVYSVGMITIFGISDLSDIRLMLGVLLLGFGPALIGIAFRAIRKHFEKSFTYFWDRLVDLAVLTFFISWSVSSMVATLPALAGKTLVVANYTAEFSLLLAIAIAVRILLEELAARGFSQRLDTINPTEVQGTSQLQKVISTAVRLFLFIFVTAAFMGNVWQVWVGSFIFILPNILSWFAGRFPNSPLLWKVLPQGIPALALTLVISSVSAGMISGWFEGNPEYPQYLFMLLPIPVFLLGLLGLFGREGKDDEERPIMAPKWRWVYRIGGIVMLAVTMNLAGVLVI